MTVQREQQLSALKVVTGVLGGNNVGDGFWEDQGQAIDVYWEENLKETKEAIRERMLEELVEEICNNTEPQEFNQETAQAQAEALIDDNEVEEQARNEVEDMEGGTYHLVGSWKKVTDLAQENIHGYAPDKDGDYAAIYDSNDNYIQVVWSKTVVNCSWCSPCFPNQGDLDTPGFGAVAYALPEGYYYDGWQVNNDADKRLMNLSVWESMQFWHNHYEQMNGSFRTALWDAIFKADLSNLRSLAKGFPQEVRCRCNYAGIKL